MCITCACDEPESDHGDPRNITLQQFKDAAKAAEVDMDKLIKNVDSGLNRYGKAKATSQR